MGDRKRIRLRQVALRIWRLRARWNLWIGLVLIGMVALAAVAAPLIPGRGPADVDFGRRAQAPSGRALLGTDQFGRDILARITWGARISLLVGVVAVLIGSLVGTTAGLASGYFGGSVDAVLMRAVDIMLTLPTILLALILAALAGPGVGTVIVAIGVASVPTFARIVRGSVLTIVGLEYVEAAHALGGGHWRIILRHLLPNVMAPIIVVFSLRVAEATLIEASLSFLGIGIQPPTPAWGSMVSEGLPFLQFAPWISIVPGVAVSLMVLGFNLLGDGLRDILDPRLARVS